MAAHAKTLAAQDELDGAAVHQERLESSLADHRAELRRLRSVLAQREIPDAFRCPITLEIMREPVIAHDGFTYERYAIESWLSSHRLSPKTGAALQSTILIDNHGVKQLIADFLDETRRLQAAIDASGDEAASRPCSRSDSDFVVPEGLVDVQRRSNCALDAIVAVLFCCPTFVRAAGRPSPGDSRALRALDASLQAAERGANADQAVDALWEALASSGDDTVIRAELMTRGAHLDVAEVLGEVVNVARPSAQQALRTQGRVSQQACRRCGHFNDDFNDVELNELARSAPAAALLHAAENNGSLERVYLEAHAHAPKTCDACRAPQACDVDVLLEQSARALVLSVGWPSASQASPDDVLALLAFVGRSGARDCGRAGAIWPDRVFAASGNNARPLDLLAVVVFQNAYYTAFVRSPDGADAWTHHDRQARIHVGAWTDVVRRCATATSPMLPYLLVYDELVAADPTAIFDSLRI